MIVRRHLPAFLILIAALGASISARAATLVSCSSSETCSISVYKSSSPTEFAQHSIEIVPPTDAGGNPIPIPESNQVTFIYDGTQFTTTCDGTQGNMGTPAGQEIQDKIACTVDRSGDVAPGTLVYVTLTIHDQSVYNHPYSNCPGYTVDDQLRDTSEPAPFCVTDDVNQAEACKWEEQNLNDPLLTQRGVPLNNWVVYARTQVTDLSLSYGASTETLPFEEGEQVCMVDVNGDGDIGEDEMASCIETAQGYLCPIQAVQCVATYSDPICPSGGTLNPDTDRCEASPSISCPSGYTYNTEFDMCTTAPDCPAGGSLNPYTDLCEVVISSSCPSGYTYDASLDACVAPVNCPSGGTYNPSRDVCEVSYTPSCDSPYAYNSGTGYCEASPQCPTGSSYSNSADKCVTTTSPDCPAGYTYNSSTGQCEDSPDCPSGGSYNGANDRCEAASSWQCSLDGQSYSTQDGCNSSCVQSGTCNPNTTYTCPSGYTLQGSVCVAQASCPCGGTLHTDNDQCFVPTPSPSCPPGGYLACDGSTPRCYSYSGPPCPSGYSETICGDTPCCVATPTCCMGTAGCGDIYFWCTISSHWVDPQCPAGGSYNGSTDRCEASPTPHTSSYTCSLNGQTYPDLNTCQSNCNQSGTCTSSCPTGYSESGTLCIANPTCSQGGSLNTTTDMCELAPSLCTSPFTYDAGLDRCVADATCPSGGTLDTSADVCRKTVAHSCPSGYTYNSTTELCESSPQCSPGYFDPSIDQCRVDAATMCPSGYTFNTSTDKCEADPSCPSPSTYSPTLDQCTTDATHDCPSGYDYSPTSKLCEAYPICQSGSYDPQQDKCYEGDNTWPYGPQYPCMEHDGISECSPNSCEEFHASNIEDDDTTQGANDKRDDGAYDQSGSCLGTIYIFNGHDRRCRRSGITTGFHNCCQGGTYWFGLAHCKGEEEQLAEMKDKGLCHYVGSYCSKKWPLVGCVQRKETYCCFNSKLGRILQEQGRPLLDTFGSGGGWGEAEGPNCRGFTPDEFQMLDFDRIDLSEWYGDITTATQSEINSNMQQRINNFYNNIQ